MAIAFTVPAHIHYNWEQLQNHCEGSWALHLELRFVTCNGAEENQAHRCDPYDLRVQEQPLFLVCSRIVFLLLWIKSHRSKNIYAGADQK